MILKVGLSMESRMYASPKEIDIVNMFLGATERARIRRNYTSSGPGYEEQSVQVSFMEF